MTLTPFPNAFEIIRFVASCLDTKSANKKIDDLARDPFSDYRQIERMIDDLIHSPIAKYVSPALAKEFAREFARGLKWYLKKVVTVSADGLERNQVMSCIVNTWFVPCAVKLLNTVFERISGMPHPILLVASDRNAINSVMQWVEENIDGWETYIKGLEKSKKDQLSKWRKAENIPSLSYLSTLDVSDDKRVITSDSWLLIKSLMFIARGVDYVRRQELGEEVIDGVRLLMIGAELQDEAEYKLNDLQQAAFNRVESLGHHIGYLQRHLGLCINKSETVKKQSRWHLDELIKKSKSMREYEQSEQVILQWDARWHVYSGELDIACKLYEEALGAAVYRSGSAVQKLVHEALTVAARQNNSILLRKLKNTLLLFALDLESVNQQFIVKPSKKSTEIIQDWEVDIWGSYFRKAFPIKGFFPGVRNEEHISKQGPLLYRTDEEVEPYYDNPNRKIKVGKNWQKTYPQIIWFIQHNHVDVVKRLIERGAKVNVKTSSDETPLLMALEKLLPAELPYRSLDDALLSLVLSEKGVKASVNVQTQKKKLTPLIQAVESGRADVVAKILALNPEVNLKGNTDNQTALNVCLKRISILNNPSEYLKTFRNIKVTPELLDSLRRETNGVLGPGLEEQLGVFSIESTGVASQLANVSLNRMQEHMTVENMKAIAFMLLEHGADCNIGHHVVKPNDMSFDGFTPLMMAIQLDLDGVVAMMLEKGGCLEKEIYPPFSKDPLSCWNLAKVFRSIKVLRLLNDIRPIYEQSLRNCTIRKKSAT